MSQITSTEKIQSRLQLLDLIVAHQFQKKIDNEYQYQNLRFFTAGEIICINQERMSLREQLEWYYNQRPLDQVRFIVVSPGIDFKINRCLDHIDQKQWCKPNEY